MMDYEYAQYVSHNTLRFILESMAYEDFVYVSVLHRLPDGDFYSVFTGWDEDALRLYGHMPVESSCVTRDGFLQVVLCPQEEEASV